MSTGICVLAGCKLISGVEGVRNLIDLAAANISSRFYFCSSTAACLGEAAPQPVPERVSSRPEDAAAMGYARSKNLAENVCAAAHNGEMAGKVGILRLGQLCGDTKEGIWKAEEGWPLLILSVGLTNCLPDLQKVSELRARLHLADWHNRLLIGCRWTRLPKLCV